MGTLWQRFTSSYIKRQNSKLRRYSNLSFGSGNESLFLGMMNWVVGDGLSLKKCGIEPFFGIAHTSRFQNSLRGLMKDPRQARAAYPSLWKLMESRAMLVGEIRHQIMSVMALSWESVFWITFSLSRSIIGFWYLSMLYRSFVEWI